MTNYSPWEHTDRSAAHLSNLKNGPSLTDVWRCMYHDKIDDIYLDPSNRGYWKLNTNMRDDDLYKQGISDLTSIKTMGIHEIENQRILYIILHTQGSKKRIAINNLEILLKELDNMIALQPSKSALVKQWNDVNCKYDVLYADKKQGGSN